MLFGRLTPPFEGGISWSGIRGAEEHIHRAGDLTNIGDVI